MSSFNKNIIPRRIHKERAQPAVRVAKHGLLEKKKDYKLRARDHNRKTARVKLLREKASFRNPDEFYYAMSRHTTTDGAVHRARDAHLADAVPLASRTLDQRVLAESQDARYVAHKLQLEKGRVVSLEKRLHRVREAATTPRTHILFADDDDDADDIVAAKAKQTALQRRSDSDDDDDLEDGEGADRSTSELKKAYHDLSAHADRCDKLNTVYGDLTVAKNLLTKGERKLVRPSDKESGVPPLFRWAQERSR